MSRDTIFKRLLNGLLVVEIGLLLIVTTITYLPNLRRATIYRDDWYYTLDRMIGGPQAFHEMFRIDRPARGYFFEVYYRMFGVEPAPYHVAGFAWRIILGLATFWLFQQLWPKQRAGVLLITLLFILYPGYTRWMEGFEDQPKVASLFLQVTSIGLTLQAIKVRRTAPRIALWAGSVLTGWGYLALIDYAMGMEAFRFLCVFALVNREQKYQSIYQKGLATLRAALPAVLVLGGFLFWRVFLFKNERPETDIKLQLSVVAHSPLAGITSWFIHLFQSIANDAFIAWGGYSFQDFFKLSTPEILTGLLIAITAAVLVVLYLYWTNRSSDRKPTEDETASIPWQREAVWIGLLGVAAGVVPVVMANRSVEFGMLSHYGLPASLASATLMGGLIYTVTSSRLRMSAAALLVLLAVMTQYAVSTKVAKEEQIVGNFWHQVAWRAPGIREATSLLVYYPSVPIGEDVDFVHGPANFIYFPEQTNELPVRYKLFAMKQYPWTVKEFMAGGKETVRYRSHYGVIDYGYVLAISQPTLDSCVHIVDQQAPWFSMDDPDSILYVGQYSNIRNVLPKAVPPQVSATIFGPEPAHGWCYYFEKADLAVQQKDWQKVSTLGEEAVQLKLEPKNALEWMPFLQASAVSGDEKAFAAAAKKINQSEYNRVQICGVLTKMQASGYSFQPAVQRLIQDQLCPIIANP